MDRRITKTKAAIRKAYLELIMEKDPMRISVTELAKRADIDRKTFYLHYSAPEEVLDEHVSDRFQKIVSAMEKSDYFKNPFNAELLIGLLDTFYKEEEDLLIVIAGGDAYNDLWKHIHDILSEKVVELYAPFVDIDDEEIRINFDMIGTGVIEVYRRWVRGEYSVDLRNLIEIINETAFGGLHKHFN